MNTATKRPQLDLLGSPRTRGPATVTKALTAALLLVVAAGCAEEPTFKFEDLNLLPIHEELTEFSLGKYMIPVPVAEGSGDEPSVLKNRLEFDFRLFALISPPEESKIETAWSQHEGNIRDQVIRVCRNATIEDLMEPDLATLKIRLIEALRPQLGDRLLRELLITEITSQEI